MVIFRFQEYFGHFFGFGGILVIFWVSCLFWSFLDLGLFWSLLKILEYFGHFYFSGILVILIIGWVGFTYNNWVGLDLS